MKRLRIFLVEILFVPIILGWLFFQYPEVFEMAVPWITLAVLLHLTWEFVVDPLKEMLVAAWRVLGRWAWVVFTTVALVVAALYLLGIESVMIDLAYNYKHLPIEPWPLRRPPVFAYDHTPTAPVQSDRYADTALEFAGRSQLQLVIANTKMLSAEKPKYWFEMIDATHCFKWPNKPDECNFLPLQTQTYSDDYIVGGSRIGPYSVLEQSPQQIARQHVVVGDSIVGIIGTTCFNCKRERRYFVYFKLGDGGWFSPLPTMENILMLNWALPEISNAEVEAYLDRQIPKDKRIQIPAEFNLNHSTKYLP